jgi:hypothetical protein
MQHHTHLLTQAAENGPILYEYFGFGASRHSGISQETSQRGRSV